MFNFQSSTDIYAEDKKKMEFNATFLVSAISFIVFTIVMNKIFYRPLERVMDERQKFIDDAKSDALTSNERAEAILKDRDERLNQSFIKSKKIVADRVNEANTNSAIRTAEAKQKSQEEISFAKSNLNEEAQSATLELKTKVKDLAETISSKILGIDVTLENSDNELVDRMLS